MCKVFKERSSENIIIIFEGGKLVFPEYTYFCFFSRHCSDIEKKQYVIKYEDGFYSFFRKKKLIVKVSSGKFVHMKYI